MESDGRSNRSILNLLSVGTVLVVSIVLGYLLGSFLDRRLGTSPWLVVTGVLGLGFFLGALPFASWAWIAARALHSGRGRALTVVLLFVKMAIYSGALYVCVHKKLVDPVGVLAGMLGVGSILIVGLLLKGSAPMK